jgi:glucose-6-phosphate isomerase
MRDEGSSPLTSERQQAWKALSDEAAVLSSIHLAELFEQNPERFAAMSRELGDLCADFSKQKITDEVLRKLIGLADASDLGGWIEKFFGGALINDTEGRSAMHWALRAPYNECNSKSADGDDIALDVDAVEAQLVRLQAIVEKIHAGQWRGCTGEVITDVVNVGVGGSDLGPLMACRALEDARSTDGRKINIHFVSTVDGSQLSHLLNVLSPHQTLFVVSSKSFTTVDTLYNATTAQGWLYRHLGDHRSVMQCHFLGVSAHAEKMTEWGICPDNQLLLWPWVGGRYSVWSAIGLPLALILGGDGFRCFLAGAHEMDEHFCAAPWLENIPVLMALIGVWNNNFLGIHAHAVLPYDGRLKYLPAYLSQLEMESNGKSVTRTGKYVSYETCPVVWGEVGPNAQHAFYQLLHQGTSRVSCDFIVAAHRYLGSEYADEAQELGRQHEMALANCLAQSRLLALGEHALPSGVDRPMHSRYQGGQPSTTFLLDELNPHTLGMLLAAYEHKVFVQAVLWDINPFDQWGVEMGKAIATETLAMLQNVDGWLDGGADAKSPTDSSTAGLIAKIRV